MRKRWKEGHKKGSKEREDRIKKIERKQYHRYYVDSMTKMQIIIIIVNNNKLQTQSNSIKMVEFLRDLPNSFKKRLWKNKVPWTAISIL